MKILVVDDSPNCLNFVVRILTKKDHEVISADNGEEAIVAFSIGDYDLVITDLEMPEMDGIKLIKELQSMYYKQKFILMSGNPVKLRESQLPENVTKLSKPFGIRDLETAIRIAVS